MEDIADLCLNPNASLANLFLVKEGPVPPFTNMV